MKDFITIGFISAVDFKPICMAHQNFQNQVIDILAKNEIKGVVVVDDVEQLPKPFKFEPFQLIEPIRDYQHFEEPKNYINGKKLPRRRFKNQRK